MLEILVRLGALGIAALCVWGILKWVTAFKADQLPHDIIKGEDWGIGPELGCFPLMAGLVALACLATDLWPTHLFP